MNRIFLWLGVTFVFVLVSAVALLHEPDTELTMPLAFDAASSTFAIGGVHVRGNVTAAPKDRNPFEFAQVQVAPLPTADSGGQARGFPVLTLDGVLLRKDEEKAFLRIGGRPFVVGRGELVDGRVRIESIDQDGVVVSHQSGERRRLHLAGQASDRE